MKTSPRDQKHYTNKTLANGLRVMFVHDEESHKSAASLVVNTGHFDDPVDRPGMAHFVEHLLFNGNSAYPEVNFINNFVSQHGGQCNAWTGTEHSNYYFDIHPSEFKTALHYFAHLFIDPLFSEDALEREQQAIHSEYKLKLKDDSRRIQQVHKQTVNPEHPFHKFSVGNRHTLSDLPQRPIREELLQFWHDNYQARFMTLVLVSDIATDELAPLVDELFSAIQSSDDEPASKQIPEPLYRQEDLNTFIGIYPVKELHKLNVTFAMPSMQELYATKTLSYTAHIIGYEGAGSLYDNLKQRGFVNALSAGNGISGSNFKDFNISIELTELGEQHLDEILECIFAYLNYLKQHVPPEYIYQEQQRLNQISFEYQEATKSSKLATQLALNMHHYPQHDYIVGDYRMDGFNPSHWQQVLDYLRADNIRVTLVSQAVGTDQKAHWYHTPFSIQDIPKERLHSLNEEQWQAYNFAYPKPNPYLAEENHLQPLDFNQTHPVALSQDLGWVCWFKQDISYRVPKGNIYVGFDLPFGVANKKNQSMMRMFCDMLLDSVAEQHYQAEMAGLHYNLYAHNGGITLYTSGLSNNQEALLLDLIHSMLLPNFELSRFEEVKRLLIKHWRNNEASKPINQLFTQLNSKLMPNIANAQELASELSSVDFEEFLAFCKVLMRQVYVEALIHGNWTTSQALAIFEQLKSTLKDCEFVAELPRQILPLSHKTEKSVEKQSAHPDAAALLYVQGINQCDMSDDITEKAMYILVSQILAPYSFNYLRTEKNLGYLAGSGYMPLCNVPGLVMYVQSHNFDATALVDNLTSCLNDFKEELQHINEQEFAHHKQAVIHQYQETANNLNQKSQQLWISVGNKDYEFNQKQNIVTELNQIRLPQLQQWANANLCSTDFRGLLLATL